MEVSSLRIALSKHKIQPKYFSINGDINESGNKEEGRNLMMESARITRIPRDLKDLSRIKVDSYKALIIPSFTPHYHKHLVGSVYNVPVIRSTIKEFHLKQKYIMALGPSSINLLVKTLDLQNGRLKTHPSPYQKQKFKFKVDEENKIIYLPYNTEVLEDGTDMLALAELNKEIHDYVVSLKYRVLNEEPRANQ